MKASLQDQLRVLLIETVRKIRREQKLSYAAIGKAVSLSAPYVSRLLEGDLGIKSLSQATQESLAAYWIKGDLTSAERNRELSVRAEKAWIDAAERFGVTRHVNLVHALMTRERDQWHDTAIELASVNDRAVAVDRDPATWLAELDSADATARRLDEEATPSPAASGESLN